MRHARAQRRREEGREDASAPTPRERVTHRRRQATYATLS